MPAWWDARTLLRLLATVAWMAGWLGLALTLAPWVSRRLHEATRGYVQWMVSTCDRMFLRVRPAWCLAAVLGSTAACGAAGWWLTSGLPPGGASGVIRLLVVGSLAFGPFGLPLGYRLPRRGVAWLWARRIRRLEAQLPDALAFLSSGLRSGLSLVQCLDTAAVELDGPLAQELGLVVAEQRVGVPLEEALLHLEARVGTEDLTLLVTSVNVLKQAGGNLSETFETIAHTLRERSRVAGRIRTLTAQGVAQATVLTIMPFVLGFVLWTIDHALVERLWTTRLGWLFLGVMFALQAAGAVLMRRMVTIRI